MKFTKMQGCGNDYIYIDGAREHIPEEKKPELVRKLSDRHFGIGGDGVIFINPSTEADFEMEMYNMDGSRGAMCGNGIRCVAKYVYDRGLTDQTELTIVSAGKIKHIQIFLKDGAVESVRVNMGSPALKAVDIPVLPWQQAADVSLLPRQETAGFVWNQEQTVISENIEAGGRIYKMTCVSMGNPHAVIFVDSVSELPLMQLGPLFEHHKRFPDGVNTEFVRVRDTEHIDMRVWERGSGETLACGTGACASVVACVLNGLTGEKVTVQLSGGKLNIEWDREQNVVYMTGPAAFVFDGEIRV